MLDSHLTARKYSLQAAHCCCLGLHSRRQRSAQCCCRWRRCRCWCRHCCHCQGCCCCWTHCHLRRCSCCPGTETHQMGRPPAGRAGGLQSHSRHCQTSAVHGSKVSLCTCLAVPVSDMPDMAHKARSRAGRALLVGVAAARHLRLAPQVCTQAWGHGAFAKPCTGDQGRHGQHGRPERRRGL